MNRYMLMALAFAITLGYGSLAWAHQTDSIYEHRMMWDGGWHGWFLGPLMMILFLAIAVAVVVLIVRWLGGTGHSSAATPAPKQSSAVAILKDRFARGEIDKEEFENKRRILEE